MAVTYNDYLLAIEKPNTHQVIKIEFLRPQDDTPYKTVIQEIVGNSGSYTEKVANGIRRDCEITLLNSSGEFTPNIDGVIWVNRKFKLYMGLRIGGEDYFIPKGEYVINNPNITPFGSDNELSFSGVDKYALLDGTLNGRLENTILIANGTNLVTAMRTLLNMAGDTSKMLYDDALYSMTLPFTFYAEAGDTLAEAIKTISEFASANVYYNENGNFVFEKDIADSKKAPVLSLSDTATENLLFGGNFSYNFDRVVNSITVIGDNVNGNLSRFTYQNTDLTSDISIPNIGLVAGDLISDDLINTDALAEQRAIYEIRRQSRMFIDGDMVFKKMYHILVDNVIEVDSVIMGWNKKKLVIDSVSIGLDVDSDMSITVKDAVEFI